MTKLNTYFKAIKQGTYKIYLNLLIVFSLFSFVMEAQNAVTVTQINPSGAAVTVTYHGVEGTVFSTACSQEIPVTIEICNLPEDGIFNFNVDLVLFELADRGSFEIVQGGSVNYVFLETNFDAPGENGCITLNLTLKNRTGYFDPEGVDVKDFTELTLNSQSNVNASINTPSIDMLMYNPIGESGTSTYLSNIANASPPNNIAGRFPTPSIACGGSNKQRYAIYGELIVDIDYCFKDMSFIMRPGSSIKITNGSDLFIQDLNGNINEQDFLSEFIPCETMWKGFIIEDGLLYLDNITIIGAEAAVTVNPETRLSMRFSTFQDNYIGVDFKADPSLRGPFVAYVSSFHGNTFEGTGNLYPLYEGQSSFVPALTNGIPYAGVRANNYVFLRLRGIGGMVTSPTNYINMEYGIKFWNSSVDCSYSLFDNLNKWAVHGEAINQNYFTHIGYNSDPSSNYAYYTDYTNCLQGIYLSKISAEIGKCHLTEMGRVAIKLVDNKYKTVNIHDNLIEAYNIGIQSIFCTPLDGHIEDNIFKNKTTISGNIRSTNIVCQEDLSSKPNPGGGWIIEDNDFLNSGAGDNSVGIKVYGGNNFEIRDNNILMTNPIGQIQSGIDMEMSSFPSLSCNTVDLDNASNSEGLSVNSCIYGEYECNSFQNSKTAVLFENDNMRNLFKGNNMSNSVVGLGFNVTAIIGQQVHKGNCWGNNSGFDLSHPSGDDVFLENSQFVIKCNEGGNSNACGCDAYVGVGFGANEETLLKPEPFGITESCMNDGEFYCPDGMTPVAPPEDESDSVSDLLSSGNYSGDFSKSLNWMSQFNYLRGFESGLNDFPAEVDILNDFLNAHSDMANYLSFQANLENVLTNYPNDNNISYEINAITDLLNEIDNTQNENLVVGLQDQLFNKFDALRIMKQNQHAVFSAWQENLNLVLDESLQNVSSSTAEVHIQNMTTTLTYYIKMLINPQFDLTLIELQELKNIGEQCIELGGPGVTLAKGIYLRYSENNDLQEQPCFVPVYRINKEDHISNSKIHPNPTKGNINIYLETETSLFMYDLQGKLLNQFKCTKGNNRILVEDLYGVFILTDHKQFKEKLLIIK